jgi:glyceraldehyde-3-phosphate dehydrogenase (NADP+)
MDNDRRLLSLFPESIPAEHDIAQPLEHQGYLLDGSIRSWDGETQTILTPIYQRNGEQTSSKELGSCPVQDEQSALAAIEAASRAYDKGRGLWPTMRVEQRIQHVEEFCRLMIAKRDEVVRLMMWEICKSLADSRNEFDRTVDYIKCTVDALKDLDRASSRFVVEQGILAQIRRAPLGPVLCMGPFNYPINETFSTLIPALIMGNPVIIKTPRLGKLLYAPLLEAFRDAFPTGVVNLLFGDRRVAQPIMRSGEVNVLAFIGSSQAADALRVTHPRPHRLRCVLGLDAKNAGIVLDSADMDLTVSEVLAGALSFNGQRCTALKIIFVAHKRVAEFLQKIDAGIQKLKMGMPWDEGVKITPLPVPGKVEYLHGLIRDAEQHGAKVVNTNGGASAASLFHPAVVYPVNEQMQLYHVEQFGPVIPVVPFDDISQPIDYILNSNYGQQLSIFGTDPDQTAALVDPMVNQVCRVNINCQCQRGPDSFPFTGRKDSAEGTLSVSDALRCFSIRTLVAAKATPGNKELVSSIVRDRKSNFLSTDFLF